MSTRRVTQDPVTQSPASSKADRIREMAKGNPQAQVVKIGGKEYYVVKITNGAVAEIPNVARVKELAKLVIGAHEEGFEHIDNEGAHYADGTTDTHKEVEVKQQALHAASEGLSGTQPTSPSPLNEEIQLTNPQNAATLILATRNGLDDVTTVSKQDIGDRANTEHLPIELQTELRTLAGQPNAVTGQEYKAGLETGFNKYIERLATEHRQGLPSDKVAAFDSKFESLKSEDKTPIDKLFAFNELTRESRTAQHAWNAMAKEAGVTQRTSLPHILGEGMHIAPVDPLREDLPLQSGLNIVPLSRDSSQSRSASLLAELTRGSEASLLASASELRQQTELRAEAERLGVEIPESPSVENLTQAITDKYREQVQSIKDTGESGDNTWGENYTWEQNIPQGCVGKSIDSYSHAELKEFMTRYNSTLR